MGLGDFFSGGMLASTVLLKLKVDPSDAIRGLKQLTGEEKKAAQAAIELQQKKNQQMDSWAKNIAKVTVGMQLAQKAVSLLGDSWKAYEKSAMAAGGADKEKAKKFRAALDEMDKSVGKFMVAVGGLVAELGPLVQIAAGLVDVISSGIGMLNRGANWIRDNAGGGDTDLAAYAIGGAGSGRSANEIEARRRLRMLGQIDETNKSAWGLPAENPWDLARRQEQERKRREEERKRGSGGFTLGAAEVPGVTAGLTLDAQRARTIELVDMRIAQAIEDKRFADSLRGVGSQSDPMSEYRAGFSALDKAAAAFGEFEKGRGQLEAGIRQSKLEEMFGPLSDFTSYANAFDILSGAMQGAFDAWVSGSLSAGQAIKKFFSDAISGVASQMFAQAIQHAAFAIGSLAFQDYRGAAVHGKAAAAFGAGAIAVGAIARAFGGGGGGSGGGGAVPSVTGGGGGGGQVTVSNTYLVGDGLSEDSPRMRRHSLGRQMRMSRAALNDSSGVSDG